jgi:Rieske Fe-S protein
MSTAPLSRRSVLRGTAVSGVAAIAGFVLARTRRPPSGRGAGTAANLYGPAAAGGRLLAPLAHVPAGGGLVLTGPKVVLVRDAGDAVHGFSAVCTHEGCLVNAVAGGTIDCPCHGSRFSAATGAVVSGPATRPLPKVAVAVRGDDVYSA